MKFKILPWEFRKLDDWKQGELVGLVMPEIEHDLEQSAKQAAEKAKESA